MPRRRAWVDAAIFAGIVLLAIVVRYAYMLQAKASPLFDVLIMDGRQYFNWASGIVGGDWLGQQVFYQAPLYPYFLAVVRLVVGDDLWPIRLVQIGLGALSCGLLFLAGLRFFERSRSAGIGAGLMLSLYPPAIFYDTLIQKAGLGLLWMTLLLWLISLATVKRTVVRMGLIGITLALLMLTREETILLAPVLLGWIVVEAGVRASSGRSARERIRLLTKALPPAAAFIGGMAAVLLPVAIRNYSVGGEFILTTSQAGPNFYIGNNPSADGMYAPLRPGRSNTPYERQDAVELAELAQGRSLTAREVSRYWFNRSFEFIRSEPGQWLKLMGRKLMLLINAYEVPDYEDQYFFERYSPLLHALSSVWHMGMLLPLAAAGVVLTARRGRLGHLRVLHAVGVTLCIAVVLFFIFGRYRFPLAPVLMLFAAGGIVQVVAMARAGGMCGVLRARAGLALGAAMGAAVLANWPLFERDYQLAIAYSNAGAAMADRGETAAALALYEEALRIDRNLPDTLANVAMIVGRPAPPAQGDLARAIALLREAAALRPNDPRIEFRLGTALAEVGDLAGARSHLARAVEHGPGDIDARTNYAMVLLHLGEMAAGAEELGHIVRQQPENLMAASFLAWILATSPDPSIADPARAVALGEHLVESTGRGNPEMLDILAAAQARAGQFDQAAVTASAAVELAGRVGEPELASEIQKRLFFYRQRQPWIER